MPERSTAAILAEIFDTLRDKHWQIAVDQQVRATRVAEALGTAEDPASWCDIVCPLIVTNPMQQERFRQDYDSAARRHASTDAVPAEVESTAGDLAVEKPRRAAYAIAAVLAVAVATVLAMTAPRLASWLSSRRGESTAQSAKDSTGTDTFPTAIVPTPANIPRVAPQPGPQAAPLRTPWYVARRNELLALAIVIPLVLLVVIELYHRDTARRVSRGRPRGPPYAWPIVDRNADVAPYDGGALRNLAQIARRREAGDTRRFSLHKTIASSIRSFGYPSLEFDEETRPTEYLFLIERASFNDHQARLFATLAQALADEQVYVAAYYFSGTPAHCLPIPASAELRRAPNDLGERVSVPFATVARIHADARVLVFAEVESLIEGVAGTIVGWASWLEAWKHRAIASASAPARWGRDARVVMTRHKLVPATIEGIERAVRSFDRSDGSIAADGGEHLSFLALPADADEISVDALEHALGRDAFVWLCACAVYPTLAWNITMHLGALPALGSNLRTEHNVLALARLSWFRQGRIPDGTRLALIERLTPDQERAVRTSLLALMRENPAPTPSTAEMRQRAVAAVQNVYLARSENEKREAKKDIEALPVSALLHDRTAIRVLNDAWPSPLDLVLPRRLWPTLYRNGVRVLGLRSVSRVMGTAVVAAIVLGAVGAVTQEPPPLEMPSDSASLRDSTAVASAPMPPTNVAITPDARTATADSTAKKTPSIAATTDRPVRPDTALAADSAPQSFMGDPLRLLLGAAGFSKGTIARPVTATLIRELTGSGAVASIVFTRNSSTLSASADSVVRAIAQVSRSLVTNGLQPAPVAYARKGSGEPLSIWTDRLRAIQKTLIRYDAAPEIVTAFGGRPQVALSLGSSRVDIVLTQKVVSDSLTPSDSLSLRRAVITTFGATPSSVNRGDSTLLRWDTNNADSVWLRGGGAPDAVKPSDGVDARFHRVNSGSVFVRPESDATYYLTAWGAGGTVTDSTRVVVRSAPAFGSRTSESIQGPAQRAPLDTLSSVEVAFTTKNDDKDRDTRIPMNVVCDGREVANAPGDWGAFKDGTTHGPYLLTIGSRLLRSDLYQCTVRLSEQANGSDSWNFDWTLVLTFSSGSKIRYAWSDSFGGKQPSTIQRSLIETKK